MRAVELFGLGSLLWAGGTLASRCKPSTPASPSASMSPSSSSSSAPAASPSTDPCANLIADPNFAYGSQYWTPSTDGTGEVIDLSGTKYCPAGAPGDNGSGDSYTCVELAIVPDDISDLSTGRAQVSQTVAGTVAGARYSVTVPFYPVIDASQPTFNCTFFDGVTIATFAPDPAAVVPGTWSMLTFGPYAVAGTTVTLACALWDVDDTDSANYWLAGLSMVPYACGSGGSGGGSSAPVSFSAAP